MDAERRLHEEGIAGDIYLFKNNTDSAGNSYGCHENYLVAPARRVLPAGRRAHPVPRHPAADLRRRQGAADPARRRLLRVSQRAEHIWEGVSSATTRSRPIINTRDEPHADAERFRRLHVIVGDSNMCETTTLLKVGATDLVLRMIEAGTVLRDLTLENPIRAIREVSHDITGRRRVRLANGREASALDIQREYYQKAARLRRPARRATRYRSRCSSCGAAPWTRSAPATSSLIDREIDWATKYQLIERYRAKHGLTLSSPRVAQLDLAYHDIHRGRGLYYLLRAARARSTGSPPTWRSSRARSVPPQTTRARLRGEFIRRAQEKRRDFTVDWVHLKLNDQAQRTVLCKDPFRSAGRAGGEAHRLNVTAARRSGRPGEPREPTGEHAGRVPVGPARATEWTRRRVWTVTGGGGDYSGRVSSRRAERLVNLVLCLLSTRQFLTAERIRTAVPGYEPDDGTARADEAFKRMFERDKAELRELGVPLETGKTSIFDTEEGYRIARRDYELPEVSLEPDEAAAVGLAARLWQSAELADAARGALLKLRAGGVDVEPARTLDVEPRLDAAEEALHPCLDAVQAGRAVRFAYRKPAAGSRSARSSPGASCPGAAGGIWSATTGAAAPPAASGSPGSLGAVSPVGPDGAVKVPTGIDLVEYVVAAEPTEFRRTARVRVRTGHGIWLRKIAAAVHPGPRGSDWDELEIGYDDTEWIADRVARQGSAAVVDGPPEVRDAVVRRLRAHAAVPAAPAPPAGGVGAAG